MWDVSISATEGGPQRKSKWYFQKKGEMEVDQIKTTDVKSL